MLSPHFLARQIHDPPTTRGTSYLTTDHLGSTRVTTDSNGAVRSRDDYLPFGEEIGNVGAGRTSTPGYSTSTDVRQKFTSKERDTESSLDFFEARYFSSQEGRFTSPDSKIINGDNLVDPQRHNLYAYTRNNPLNAVDPDGKDIKVQGGTIDQQQAMKNAVATERAQSTTANDQYSPFDDPKVNLVITITPDETFEQNLGPEVTASERPNVQAVTGSGRVITEANQKVAGEWTVVEGNVNVAIRSSAVDKKSEDHDRKAGKETRVEGIMGHESVHANEEVNKHEQMKNEKETAKKKNTPYRDRPYEQRADEGLKQIGCERIAAGHIKSVRKDVRFPAYQ